MLGALKLIEWMGKPMERKICAWDCLLPAAWCGWDRFRCRWDYNTVEEIRRLGEALGRIAGYAG